LAYEPDITAIPVSDGFFGVIPCNEVLLQVPEPILAVKGTARILKRLGNLILAASFASLVHFAPYPYYAAVSAVTGMNIICPIADLVLKNLPPTVTGSPIASKN